jgi:hypothetical protein
MGLKVATFTKTNQFGGTENIYLTWKKILDADIAVGGLIGFGVYENANESARNNHKDIYRMPITQSDILGMFAQTGNVAIVISDVSWNLALTTPFIPDFVLNEEFNRYEMVLKSLTDLNATVTDIGNPFE